MSKTTDYTMAGLLPFLELRSS